jgi:hypothetical protein
MKKIFLTLVLFFIIHGISYSQNWIWANHFGGIHDEGGGSVIDLNGNSYIAGPYFSNNCYFNTDTITLNGGNDIFFAKYDLNGNELWVKKFGGFNPLPFPYCSSSDCCETGAVIYDPYSNAILMTVSFCGSISFDTIVLTSSNSLTDIALVKFDLNGNCLWAKKFGSLGDDFMGLTTDSIGNIYMCGICQDSASFDSISISPGGFLAKLDNKGVCLWAKNKFRYFPPYNNADIRPYSLAIYNSSILLSGATTNDTIIIDTITIINPINYFACVISSFDLNGNIKWLKLAGGPNVQSAGPVTVDQYGNSYITGTFTGVGYFENDSLTNGNQHDAFLAKYDINGSMQWSRQLQASNGSWGRQFQPMVMEIFI